jgi:hypothetical protein
VKNTLDSAKNALTTRQKYGKSILSATGK